MDYGGGLGVGFCLLGPEDVAADESGYECYGGVVCVGVEDDFGDGGFVA